jgi:hypothetical protein
VLVSVPLAAIVPVVVAAYAVVQVLLNYSVKRINRTFVSLYIVNGALLVGSLGVVAYHSHSTRYTDFRRMGNEMHNSTNLGLGYLLDAYNTNPLSAIVLKLVALTDAYDLLKVFSAFVLYSAIVYISYSMLMYTSDRWAVLFCTVFMLLFLDFAYAVVDNIRFFPAAAVASAALVRHMLSGARRWSTVAWCVVAALFHAALWFVVVIYCIAQLRLVWMRAVASIVVIAFQPLLLAAVEIWGGRSSIMWKMDLYFRPEDEHYQALASVEQVAFYAFVLFWCSGLLLAWRQLSCRVSLTPPRRVEYVGLLQLSLCFCIGSLSSNVTFVRFVPVFALLCMPVLAVCLTGYFAPNACRGSVGACGMRSRLFPHVVFLAALGLMALSATLRILYNYGAFYVT